MATRMLFVSIAFSLILLNLFVLRAQPYEYLVQMDSILDMSDYELSEGVYDVDSVMGLDSVALSSLSTSVRDVVYALRMLSATGAEDLAPMLPDDAVYIDTGRGGAVCSYGFLQRIWVVTSDSLLDSVQIALIRDSLVTISDIERLKPSACDTWPPNDPFYIQQDQFFSTPYNLDLPRARQYSYGTSKVAVAIVDMGVDYMHEDLGGGFGEGYIVVDGYDFTNNDTDPRGEELNVDGINLIEHHATPIAGIIAASSDNGIGVSGIAGGYRDIDSLGVDIYSYRVTFSGERDGELVLSQSDEYKAIWHASDHNVSRGGLGADVVNCSFSGEEMNFNALSHNTLYQYVYHAFMQGAVVVTGRGNEHTDGVRYPADFARGGVLLAVSGLTNDGALHSGSSFGNVSISAPWRTSLTTQHTLLPDIYDSFRGTSNAAPTVSGAAALVISSLKDRGVTYVPDDIMQMLYAGADRTGMAGYSHQLGHGRLNVGQAVHLANEPFVLEHYLANASKVIANEDPSSAELMGFRSEVQAYYITKKRKITASFTIPEKFQDLDSVWIWINSNTLGRPLDNPSWDVGGGYVESANGRTWTFSTYVFERTPLSGVGSHWYPCHPDDALIRVSVLGKVLGCDASETVANTTVNGYRYYTAEDIVVGPNVKVVLPGHAKFHASNSVQFLPGFHAEHESRMHAFIAGLDCSGSNKYVPGASTLGEPAGSDVTSRLILYPNPSSSTITVEMRDFSQQEGLEVEIVNSLGQTVYSVRGVQSFGESPRFAVNIADLPQGAYTFLVRTSEFVRSHPFVKRD